jgi:hypothetical protein
MLNKELIATTSAKLAIGLIPYIGEIEWQLDGSPGRQQFSPLEHFGNVGVPSLSVIMSGLILAEPAERYIAKEKVNDPLNVDLSPEERVDHYVNLMNYIHRRFFIPMSLGVAALAGTYSEVFDSGTHDPIDAAYTVGATGVVLFLYDRLRQREFKNIRRTLKQSI